MGTYQSFELTATGALGINPFNTYFYVVCPVCVQLLYTAGLRWTSIKYQKLYKGVIL